MDTELHGGVSPRCPDYRRKINTTSPLSPISPEDVCDTPGRRLLYPTRRVGWPQKPVTRKNKSVMKQTQLEIGELLGL
jgi:hypothetical protein